jgi:hypothetical protein
MKAYGCCLRSISGHSIEKRYLPQPSRLPRAVY